MNDAVLDDKSESPVSDDEVDMFSEDTAESNMPFSSTPSKQSDTQILCLVEISSTHPTVMLSGLIQYTRLQCGVQDVLPHLTT